MRSWVVWVFPLFRAFPCFSVGGNAPAHTVRVGRPHRLPYVAMYRSEAVLVSQEAVSKDPVGAGG